MTSHLRPQTDVLLTADWCSAHHDQIAETYNEILDKIVAPAGTRHQLTSTDELGAKLTTRITIATDDNLDDVERTEVLMYISACVARGVKLPLLLRTFEADGTQTMRAWMFDGTRMIPLDAESVSAFYVPESRVHHACAWDVALAA